MVPPASSTLTVPVDDHEQAGALLARLQQHVAGGQLDLGRELRDVPEPDLVEVGEHRDRAQSLRKCLVGVGHEAEPMGIRWSVRTSMDQ